MPTKSLRKVTSKQVAKLAGVSQTTVSFVLNKVEGANISEETRERVIQAARDLNYVPDIAARSLARGKSNNIALVFARPHRQIWIDEYVPQVLTGINEVTEAQGIRILVEVIDSDQDSNPYLNLLNSKEAAGIISVTYRDLDPLIECASQGLPVVSLDNVHPDLYSVEVDKMDGVRKLARHVLSLGHTRIGCISYAPYEPNSHHENRINVFAEEMTKVGLRLDRSLIRYGAYDPDTGYEAMKSLLENGTPPTALYALNDVMAFGAMRAIREHGLRVPEDISVVGFDNIRLAAYSSPPLTTVIEPDVEVGRRAAQLLLQLIAGDYPPEKQIRLETELIVRESCGARLQK